MARYSHLPIYNTAFQLLNEFYQRIPKFDKQYKYLLGGEILKINIEIVRLILEVNNEKDKRPRQELMKDLIWQAESLNILLRIAYEMKQLGGEKSYLFLMEKTISLVKQAESWRKSI